MGLRLIVPLLKLRAWWVAKRLEVLSCEGDPGRSNGQSAIGKERKTGVRGYERHDQCSCSMELVVLSTNGSVQDEHPYAARPFSIMVNGWLRD